MSYVALVLGRALRGSDAALGAGALSLLLAGCSRPAPEASGPLGQLALRLAAVSAKAEEYLLTDATFHYSGASEGTIQVLSVGVDDSEDATAGNGCPDELCGPIDIDFEDQPAGTVISDQYAGYLSFSTPAAPPVVVHVIAPSAGHAVCADTPDTTQCHFEMDLTFTRPVEGLSLSVLNSSRTIVTHGSGIATRTVLSTSVQSFADLHEVTRVQFSPIGPLGSIRSLGFSMIPRVD